MSLGLHSSFSAPRTAQPAAKSAWHCVALCSSNGIIYLLVGFAILTEQLLCLDGVDQNPEATPPDSRKGKWGTSGHAEKAAYLLPSRTHLRVNAFLLDPRALDGMETRLQTTLAGSCRQGMVGKPTLRVGRIFLLFFSLSPFC